MKSIEELISKFKNLNTEFKDLTNQIPVVIGVQSVKYIQKNFTNKSFDGGPKWKEISPTTKEFYDKRKLGKKGTVFNSDDTHLLWQTGNLRDSIQYKIEDDKKISVGIPESIISSLVPYAKIHNEGGSFLMFGKIPKVMTQRKYLGWSAGLRDNIRKNALSKFNVLMKKYL